MRTMPADALRVKRTVLAPTNVIRPRSSTAGSEKRENGRPAASARRRGRAPWWRFGEPGREHQGDEQRAVSHGPTYGKENATVHEPGARRTRPG
jgi:hypothetical protein